MQKVLLYYGKKCTISCIAAVKTDRHLGGVIWSQRTEEVLAMRHLTFYLGLLLRRQEPVPAETEFLGFETFLRPLETDDVRTASSPDKASRTSPSLDKKFLEAA